MIQINGKSSENLQMSTSRCSKILSVLYLCIERASSSGEITSLISALYAINSKLLMVKLKTNTMVYKQINAPSLGVYWNFPSDPAEFINRINRLTISQISPSSSSNILQISKVSLKLLPPELLMEIFKKCRQGDLFTLSRVCKSFNRIATLELYNNVRVSSISALHKFINSPASKQNVKTITFLPFAANNRKCPDLINSNYSSLFRVSVCDRNVQYTPILMSLLNICPSLNSIKESSSQGNYVHSNYNLAQILLSVNRLRNMCRVYIGSRVISRSSKELISNAVVDVKMLFDVTCFIVKQPKPKNIENVIHQRCISVLNAISTNLLFNAQYVTNSSQRLLDSYCILYYKALADANLLDTSRILTLLKKISRLEISEKDQECVSLNVMKSVYLILECVSQNRTSFEEFDWNAITPSTLRNAFLVISPTNVNSETGEFLETLILGKILIDYNSDEIHVLNNLISWISDVVIWQKANRELMPIREFLKSSLKSIDEMRALQQELKIDFLD